MGTLKPRHISKQKGSSLVEYALLIALIAMMGMVSIRTLGERIADGPLKDTRCALATGGGSNDLDCTADEEDDLNF